MAKPKLQHPDTEAWATDGPGVARPAMAANDDDQRFLARMRRSALLNRFVEAEILPRLARADHPSPEVTTEGDTTELIRLLLGQDDAEACLFVKRLQARGVAPANLYLGIIADAARGLGALWDDDRCDFSQVTIGLGRLQQMVRALSPAFQNAAVGRSAPTSTILLLPAPGEQHTMGLMILAEFFQREGWHVAGGPVSTGYDAVALVRDDMVHVVGFSIGSIRLLDPLTSCIRAVRKASRNRDLGVMVGGPLVLQRPELVAQVGADATATDAPEALRQAKFLLIQQAASN